MTLRSRDFLIHRARSTGLAVVLWLFGLSTTILLIGLWGRSVATDDATLEASAHAVLESELVNDRVTEWIGDGMAAATDTAPEDVAGAVERVAASPAVHRVLEDLVDQSVAAALAPPGALTRIDLTESVGAVVPVVVDALEDEGIPADPEVVRQNLDAVPDLMLATDAPGTISGSARSAAHVLTWVLVIGLSGLAAAGAGAIAIADDRIRQARSLAIRLGVSAMTFAIILRLGAWAVDPRGGRSPIRAGGSRLLGSNAHVPLLVALAAAVLVAGVSYVLFRRRRRIGTAPLDTAVGDHAETGTVAATVPV
jgi:hypothetical protein